MKSTEIYDVNVKELRGSVRARLTERAQRVALGLRPTISKNLQEAYSDSPMSASNKMPYFSKEDVRQLMATWETPNANDSHYEDNYNNPVHRSKEGIAKLKNGTDNANNASADSIDTSKSIADGTDSNFDHNNTIRLMKDLYFRESVDTTYLDTTDNDTSDEEAFKNALIKAQTLGEVIELELDDGTTLDLDLETIAKILAHGNIFHQLMDNMSTIESVTSLLGITMGDDDGTTDGLGESELPAEDDADVLLNGRVFVESVLDYLDSCLPEAIAQINVANFQDSPKSFDEVAKTLDESIDSPNSRNFISRGRSAMVNRVRGGELQLRKVISDSPGYKVKAGVAVRMQPAEIKKRKISARFAAKKRRNMQASINRKTKISMRLHNRRLTQ